MGFWSPELFGLP